MKKIVLILGLLFSTQLAFTQAPEKINYQAVARDASGNPLVNQTLNVTYQIRQSSPTGTSVYTETHSGISTNQFGLFTAEIGGGTPSVGTFAGINWGAGLYYLYVEVNGDPMGSSQLLSVPYALYAKQSANGPQGLPGRNSISIVTPEPAGANCQNGGNKIDVGTDDNGDNILQALEIDFTYFVCNGDSGTAVGDDWGNQVVVTQGSNISGDGTTANPLTVINNDNDSTNEFQTLSINANTLAISNGNSVTLPAAPTYTAGTGINLAGNVITNTAPDQTVVLNNGTGINVTGTYPNFTINNTSPASGINITGGGITNVTSTPPNFTISTPAQTLTYTAPNLTLSNGGGTVTIPPSPWTKSGSVLHPSSITDFVGIGIPNPSAPLHIINPNQDLTNLMIASRRPLDGGDVVLSFSEDSAGTQGMGIKYDGIWNRLDIGGGVLSTSPIMTITRTTERVGIGTTSPEQKLDVIGYTRIGAGAGNANMGLLLATPAPGIALIRAGGRAYTDFRIEQDNNAPMTLHTNGLERIRIAGTGEVLVGTSTLGSQNPKVFIDNSSTSTSNNTSLEFSNSYNGTSTAYGIYNRMTPNGTGGITGMWNYITPSATSNSTIYGFRNLIHNNGNGTRYGLMSNINANGTGIVYGSYNIINHIGSGAVYGFRLDATGSTTTGTTYGLHISGPGTMINYIGGNTGIGIISPVNKLDVEGAAVIGAPYSGTNTAPINGLLVYGNVGLGIASPTYRLQLSTNSAAKPISNAWTVASDKNLKKDIKPFIGGLADVLKINPVWFTYNGKAGMPDETGVGVIAQELQKVAPFMVSEWEFVPQDEKTGEILGAPEKYLGVDNGAMTYMLINAIKEQQQMIEELQKEIQELKNK